jgi:hypothetical protein
MTPKIALLAGIAVASLVTLGSPASAATIYNAASGLAGNQNWAGTLGLDFTVAAGAHVKVTSLGTFDNGGDGINNDIQVGIFNLTTGALVSPVLNFNGTVNATGAAYVFKALLTPIVLGSGSYQLGAWGYNLGSDCNYNNGGPDGPVMFNSLIGLLRATGSEYSYSAGSLATNIDNGATRYGAGSFIATSAVPEPAAWVMMLVGLGGIGLVARSRKRATQTSCG